MTKIDWVGGTTWNPLVGCTPVSEGCDHCYAARFASRGLCPAHKGTASGGKWLRGPRPSTSRLEGGAGGRVFVGSMTDLFHPDVQEGEVEEARARVADRTAYFLTKRPAQMREHLDAHPGRPNEWWGVSAETERRFRERAWLLIHSDARHRFVSLEPLLGPIDVMPALVVCEIGIGTSIGWVIAGPETGPGARPCDPAWIQSIAYRCQAAGVPFWDKRQPGIRKERP